MMYCSNHLLEEIESIRTKLKAIPNLIESLQYWLPDEDMIPKGHEEAWYKAVEVLALFEE